MECSTKCRNMYKMYKMYELPAMEIDYKLLVLVNNIQKSSIDNLKHNACWLENM